MKKKNLRFVIALRIEAEPLLDLYKLKKYQNKKKSCIIYNNIYLNIWLVISGIGNINASKATKHLYKESPKSKKNIWVNIGMAGSNNYEVGEIFSIKKITFRKKSFYTSSLLNNILPSSEAKSVNKIESKFYKKNIVYEMESYGFITEVEKFCFRELICIIKIVSDNKKNAPTNFVKNTRHYFNYHIKKIEKTLDGYIKIATKVSGDHNYNLDCIEKKFSLTFSYRLIVSSLVVRFEKIYSKNILQKTLDESKNLQDFIKKLKYKIKEYQLKI